MSEAWMSAIALERPSGWTQSDRHNQRKDRQCLQAEAGG
jgi:hypothetical protein